MQQASNSAVIEHLQQRFIALLQRLTDSQCLTDVENQRPKNRHQYPLWQYQLWQDICHHYSEPQRHYHTLTHLAQMFHQFDKHQNQLHNPNAIELAIWYHDIIYDPTQTDNERQSADYFQRVVNTCPQLADLVAKQNNLLIQQVTALIMMTAKHEVSQADAELEQKITLKVQDSQYFLDMDLAILGSPRQVYQDYARQVRLEYAHVNDSAFKQGRKAVLERFLQRERLYFTQAFYAEYEQNARHNIQQEIRELTD
ncbi:hypothetical protein [Psychrobacter sp. FDAARGOS_221]|uniref:HD domain-containing protein n=1 Tax=Psychrobacter sp. FDAARGOS_221 TaxID=1975705 RepID=UPI000BB5913C|nr:hypothetical protein [Psychrobacter sp. FDAARGOS_221]PNK61009.1 hypothetical protein A6J60_009025 [Psychrobacter sp. FDAARGOS_221]